MISSNSKTLLTIPILTANSALNIKRDELHAFVFVLRLKLVGEVSCSSTLKHSLQYGSSPPFAINMHKEDGLKLNEERVTTFAISVL